MADPIIEASAHADADLIPVRMCNELVYCPRLFHLEHVQGVFVHSADTIEGAGQHERARRRGTRLRVANSKSAETEGEPKSKPKPKPKPKPKSESEPTPTPESPESESAGAADDLFDLLPRKLRLASERIGVRGEIDLVEVTDGTVVVVEAKHGHAPRYGDHRWGEHELPYAAWPADVAQVALYMALLRDADIPCDEARIYYRGSRKSATVAWGPALEAFAQAVVGEARRVAAQPVAPAPLLDSPKCPGCSLHEICLPDEHHALQADREGADRPAQLRRIVPGRDDRAVVHVLTPGTTVRKDGDALVVAPRKGDAERFLLKDVGHLALFGPVHVTEPCMQHMLRSGLSVSHHTSAGRLLGTTTPLATRNVQLRRAQYRAADDTDTCLAIAKALVVAKVRNQRTVLRRHRGGLAVITAEDAAVAEPGEAPEAGPADVALSLRRMKHAMRSAAETTTIDALRGFEGEAAARYFEVFPAMLPRAWRNEFRGRSRRPPRDRVNAMLSFGYAQLVRDAIAALARVGLDPMLGLYHTMIPGRPALALDLVEPFRAAWVDTAVLRLLATGGIERTAFHTSGAGVEMTDAGRRALVRAYDRRASEETTHPRFGYRMSYRRLMELEARILAKVLVGELEQYTPMWTR
jgi:CRISPR-associated protein Cas1